MENEKKNNVILIILLIIIGLLLLVVVGLLLKDKINIPFISSNKTEQKENKETTVTNDDSKNTTENTKKTATTRTAEELLEVYYNAQVNGDYGRFLSVVPSDMQVYISKYYKQTDIKERSQFLKEKYGDDVKVTINFEKTIKKDDSFVKDTQTYLEKEVGKTLNITECYSYSATATYTGSKGTQIDSSNDEMSDISKLTYCKVNNNWGLIFG